MKSNIINADALLEWLQSEIDNMDEESEYSRASALRIVAAKVVEMATEM